MSSHRGTRARGYRLDETGDYGRARPGRRRGLVRFWPAMALLAVSLTSAWAVGEIHIGGSQGIVFADSGSRGSGGTNAGQNANTGQNGGAQQDAPPPNPGSPADDAVNAGTQPSGGRSGGTTAGGKTSGGTQKPPPAPRAGTQPGSSGGSQSARLGPVSKLDREFLTELSQAALWQRPIGVDASKRASRQVVKSAGTKIAAEQAGLATKAESVASQLNLQLPTQPTREQQAWMSEIQAAKGTAYDQVFVDRMRSAQGTIFPLVSEARSTTQNSLVRGLSQLASTATLRNMTFLEQTGLVGPGSLGSPPPTAPNTGGQGSTNGGTNGSLDPTQGDLLPGDSLDGGNQGGNTGGNTTSPSTGTPAGSAPNRTRKPGANAPTDPLDLPQGNPSDNQAGSVATTPTSSILGPNSGNTGMYIIIAMLAIAGLIFLIGLRGFYRRPR